MCIYVSQQTTVKCKKCVFSVRFQEIYLLVLLALQKNKTLQQLAKLKINYLRCYTASHKVIFSSYPRHTSAATCHTNKRDVYFSRVTALSDLRILIGGTQPPRSPLTATKTWSKQHMKLGFTVLVSKLPHTGMQFISKEIVRTKGSHEEKNHAWFYWHDEVCRYVHRNGRTASSASCC